MCLSRITTTYDNPSDLIVDGWKEFSGRASSLHFSNMGGDVVLDAWLHASESDAPAGIKASDGKRYKAGFHAYADERKHPDIRRVYLRRITCVGDQDGKKAVIAQEMYVPSDQTAWPPPPQAKKGLIERITKPGGKK